MSPLLPAEDFVLNTADTPPFSTLKQDGFYDLLINEIFRRSGDTVSIRHLPSERSITDANLGKSDGEFARTAGMGIRYPKLVMVPEPLADFRFSIFTRDPDIQINSWRDLAEYRVAFITGWKILEDYVLKAAELHTVNEEAALFQMLEADRIDLFIYNDRRGQRYIQKNSLGGIYILPKPLTSRKMYLYLHTRHRDKIPAIVKILRQIKSDGTYQRLQETSFSAGPSGE